MIKVYNKAIRDKIPEIIESSGASCIVEVLDDEKFVDKLVIKLDEEIEEYKENKSIEEMCDLIEIAYRIAEIEGVSNKELEEMIKKKNIERGKFEKNLFLVKVYEK
jgi:predicted house-cleaning noncanonical NTP pyrophosphatase (MazG superfamily)